MKITAYRINEQRLLEPADGNVLFDRDAPGESSYWIDIEGTVADAVRERLAPLDLHPLVLEICLDPVPSSRVAPLPGSLVVRFSLQTAWNELGQAVLAMICLPRRLITIHDGPLQILDDFARDFGGAVRLHGTNTSAVLYQILDQIIDHDMDLVLAARRHVDQLEDAVEEDVATGRMSGVLAVKRSVVRLTTHVEDQHHCANTLQTLESKFFSIVGLQEYMRDTLSHSEHTLRTISRQESRLNELYQHYQLSLHDKADNRLRILTIISAVFMPLTLITGIYGMNFHWMPELGWPYAYPTVLLVMLCLSGGMLWNFHRRGWFQ